MLSIFVINYKMITLKYECYVKGTSAHLMGKLLFIL